jgi:endonuclease YncB( thermonuclease family)
MTRLLLILCLALPRFAVAEFEAIVVGVYDGETLELAVEGRHLKLRLLGIDAPEAGQPHAARSRNSLAELCESKTVRVDEVGVDERTRVFGRVECGGMDASEEQVRRGMAWVYRNLPGSNGLYIVQAAARADRRGLWSDDRPVPPWEWHARAGRRTVQ